MDKSRRYIVAVFLLSSILFVLFCGVLYSQNKVSLTYNENTVNSYETLRRIRSTYINILDMETGKRGFLITRDQSFLAPFEEARVAVKDNLDELDKLITLKEKKEKVAELRAAVADLEQAFKNQIDRAINAPAEPLVMADFYVNKGKMDHARKLLEELAEVERSRLFGKLQSLKSEQENYLYTLILGTIFAIGSLLVANLIIMGLATRGKKAEKELKESQERFSTVMNGVNDGIYEYDFENKSVYYSDSYKKMLGYGKDEMKETLESFKKLLHPDDVENAFRKAKDYMERKTDSYTNVFRMMHKNGAWRWVLSRGVGIWDRNDKIKRLIGAHTDITEQKEREEELKQVNADLEGFTYIASHDLRSPLVNLKGFAGEIKHSIEACRPILEKVKKHLDEKDRKEFEYNYEQEIPDALGFIGSAVERMDKLTSAILDLSKIGKREFRHEQVNTREIVERCIKAQSYEIVDRNIRTEVHELPIVNSDHMALEQVFSNIIENAVKYMTPGREGKIVIDSFNAGYYTIFTVQDNGRGIAEQDFKRVFDFFRRASNSSDVRGSGMGMAYVKATLRKLGGNIWFESQLGEGTCFYFSLPKTDSNKETKNA